MKQVKHLILVKWTSALLAIFLGITAFYGVCCTSLILEEELYSKSLQTVLSENYKELQKYYSYKIYTEKQNTQAPPVINNMEYGILISDGQEPDITDKDAYIFSGFSKTEPDKSSVVTKFSINNYYHTFHATLLSSLLKSSLYGRIYDVSGSKLNTFIAGLKNPPAKNYWIVSNVNKPVNTDGDDLFAKQTRFLTFLHKNRYPIAVLTLLSGIGFIISIIVLCYSIKCQCKNTTIALSVCHKIPLIVLSAIAGFAVAYSLCFMTNTMIDTREGYYSGHIGVPLITASAFVCLTTGILFLMNLLTRCYSGVLWKYTFTQHFVSGIKNICQFFSEHTSLFLKGICLYFILWFIEVFIALYIHSFADIEFAILFNIVVSLPVYLFILIQLHHLQEGSRQLAEGNLQEKINTGKMFWEFKKHGEYLNQISDGMAIALEEQLRSERFKTELITNVSHDIKTPLTSIINYVDLLQKENITEEDRTEYLKILDRQSARLKKLTEDLIEASKASTKNLAVNTCLCDIGILLSQTVGEYEEKLLANNLELVVEPPEKPIIIQTDSRHLWRIFDNLMNNICKYAQPGTRVYINQETDEKQIYLIFLNISKSALNISGDELMERFIRGDSSRNTEGSGLGLSIAQSLAELLNGTLELQIVGDLFKVILSLPYTEIVNS